MSNINTAKKHTLLRAFTFAFPKTIPILTGFLFLGMTYGLYMRTQGFSFLYPVIMAMVIFGGSLEFLAVSMLLSTFAPLQTLLMAIMIQARHLFYGIAMLEKYKNMGKKKFYLIYALCDETFSINFSMDVPEDQDAGWVYFFVSILNQLYWITGAFLGSVLGNLLFFNTEGLDFVMTAMFVVIFMDQFLKEKKHYTAYIGVAASIICLLIFGANNFIIPTMVVIVTMLTVLRKPIEKAGGFVE